MVGKVSPDFFFAFAWPARAGAGRIAGARDALRTPTGLRRAWASGAGAMAPALPKDATLSGLGRLAGVDSRGSPSCLGATPGCGTQPRCGWRPCDRRMRQDHVLIGAMALAPLPTCGPCRIEAARCRGLCSGCLWDACVFDSEIWYHPPMPSGSSPAGVTPIASSIARWKSRRAVGSVIWCPSGVVR